MTRNTRRDGAARQELQGSEARFQAIVENSHEGIIFADAKGAILYRSTGFKRITGFENTERIGRVIFDIVHPDDLPLVRRLWSEMLSQPNAVREVPCRIPHVSGTWLWTDTAVQNLLDNPSVRAVALTTRDVTDRVRARQTERATFAISQAALFAPSLDELYRAIHGIVRELMPAENLYIALHDDRNDVISFPYFADTRDERPAPKRPDHGLTEYVLRSGRALLATPEVLAELEQRGEVELFGSRSIDWLGVPLKSKQRTFGVLAVQSYTEGLRYTEQQQSLLEFVSTQVAAAIERKRAEESLQGSEELLRLFVEHAPAALAMFDREMRYLAVSRRWMADYDLGDQDVLGRSHYAVFPEMPEPWKAAHRRGLAGEVVRVDEEALQRADGSVEWNRWEVRPWHLAADVVGGVIIFSENITERKRAAEAVRESELRYRTLFEQAGDYILLLEVMPEGPPVIRDMNAASLQHLGYSSAELVGRPLPLLQPTFELEPFRRRVAALSRGARSTFETRFRCKNGAELNVEMSASATVIAGRQLVLGVGRDLTERRRAEEAQASVAAQVQEAQKMESVGRLAGGVAHDFNNCLQVILLSAEQALVSPDATPALRRHLSSIEKTSRNAAGLVAQLMAFARRQPTQPKSLDLNEVTASFLPMLSGLIGEDVSVDWSPGTGVGAVWLDPAQFEQVVVNLATNARDAMSRGGHLMLSTAAESRGEGGSGDLPPGDYVRFEMADDGCGMSEEVLAHVFEPFFTTKPRGEGTGLGLASVFGIVKQNDGSIDLTSTPGRGTKVTILWPRYRAAAAPSPEARPAIPGSRAAEVLLVVDDDPMVLDVSVACLQAFGYTVLRAAGPREALRVAEQHPGPIQLLVTDVVMPGIGGPELADLLAMKRPGLRRLFVTGQEERALAKYGLVDGRVRVVRKPYEILDLAQAVRATLDDPAPEPAEPSLS